VGSYSIKLWWKETAKEDLCEEPEGTASFHWTYAWPQQAHFKPPVSAICQKVVFISQEEVKELLSADGVSCRP